MGFMVMHVTMVSLDLPAIVKNVFLCSDIYWKVTLLPTKQDIQGHQGQ